MAVTFLEPGGDATFAATIGANGFWGAGSATIATDFVHNSHIKSFSSTTGAYGAALETKAGASADTGTRVSGYFYLVAYPASVNTNLIAHSNASNIAFSIAITPAGVLRVQNTSGVQIGSNGPTLSLSNWYRVSVAYTITSTTINRIEVFVDGVSAISITNGTVSFTGNTKVTFGNFASATGNSIRMSDLYIDNSSSLVDTGNIWVTAKRPNANGTVNNFSTQIGAGGSGYGSGHSPQVNERPLSTTNGWSVVAVGTTTEEYNIESTSTGDIDISAATIVDYLGWISTKALVSETGQIIMNNVTSSISVTSTITLFTAIAGSSTYPAGTGTDIGMNTDATATTVSLYECGILVAYIPTTPPPPASTATSSFMLMGVG